MNKALPISRLIKVDVNLAPNAAQSQDISTLLILGNSGIIDNTEKIRRYDSIDAVAFDFGTTTPEYKAAVLWFEQSPQPASLLVGNWQINASHAKLVGAPLTTQQQLLSNFTAITNGYFDVVIDGIYYLATNVNLSGAINLNGVAQALQESALENINASGFIANVVWDATASKFIVTSTTQGTSSTIDFFKKPNNVAKLTFVSNPPNNSQLLIGEGNETTPIIFSDVPGNDRVLIGSNVTDTVLNLYAFLLNPPQGTSTVIVNSIAKANFSVRNSALLSITATVKNPLTVFSFVPNGSFAGVAFSAPLAGQNTYGLFGNTPTNLGAYLVQGTESQAPLQAVVEYDNNFGQTFYGLTVLNTTDDQSIDIANFIEAANNKHIFAVSTIEAGSIVGPTTTDIGSRLKALNLKRTLCQYSSTNPYSAISLLSRILTTNYNANNTVITLMYKQEPGIVAEQLSATEIGVLESKNINVFVAYNNNTAIIEQGKMSNGYFIDEVTGTDWLALAIQTEIFNALYTSTTKIPQTDSGVHTLLTVAESVCAQGVINGLLAPGVWNTQGFGSLNQGDYLPKGFYVYAASVNTQSSANRAARKSPPIQVAAKLAGAIHTVDVIINVNR